jgi:peptide deformylase
VTIRRVLSLGELDLGRAAQPVGRIDASACLLAADLIDTMRASPGCVGLAAPQIGDLRRAFVIDVTGNKKTLTCHGELVVFDPILLEAADLVTEREGCMSVPDLTGDVARARRIVVRALDGEGKTQVIETDGFEARAFLHEIDHLNGLVFLDRLMGPSALHARRNYQSPPSP